MLLSLRRGVFVLCCALFMLLTAPMLRAQVPMPVIGLPDFTALYEKQGPTVVSIDVRQKTRGYPMMGMSEDDPFYEFFKRFGMPSPQQRRSEPEGPQATGSGFIISTDGYVVTNAHVIDSADDVKVKLTDKSEYTAQIIGFDKRTDVALLKIEVNHPLPTVVIGDPEKLKVGEWVVAIGKPLGLENTMTAGIVSAKGRDLPQENLVPFIQTDTAINPGNSGGPLFNLKGEVVGINSMIYTRTGGYMGLSFAIPIDVAMNTINQIKASGKVTRGRIGVIIQEVGKDVAEAFGLKSSTGALVNSVEKDGPADKAGVKAGDIILKVDGREVRNSSELPRIITMLKPGSKTELTLWRDSATKNVSVTIAEAEDGGGLTMGKQGGKGNAKPTPMGLVLSDLTVAQKKQLDIKNGVIVEDIRGQIRGDLQAGDVIIAVIQRGTMIEAKSAAQLNGVLGKLDKKAPVTLQILRGDKYFFATIRVIEE
ncbi:MAG: DegQ family serine endoprotease [Burkholderiales bacterium]|jgi:serine protease Do|nr:DegQ family serine endoprotease [Burkholderiales bacterium]